MSGLATWFSIYQDIINEKRQEIENALLQVRIYTIKTYFSSLNRIGFLYYLEELEKDNLDDITDNLCSRLSNRNTVFLMTSKHSEVFTDIERGDLVDQSHCFHVYFHQQAVDNTGGVIQVEFPVSDVKPLPQSTQLYIEYFITLLPYYKSQLLSKYQVKLPKENNQELAVHGTILDKVINKISPSTCNKSDMKASETASQKAIQYYIVQSEDGTFHIELWENFDVYIDNAYSLALTLSLLSPPFLLGDVFVDAGNKTKTLFNEKQFRSYFRVSTKELEDFYVENVISGLYTDPQVEYVYQYLEDYKCHSKYKRRKYLIKLAKKLLQGGLNGLNLKDLELLYKLSDQSKHIKNLSFEYNWTSKELENLFIIDSCTCNYEEDDYDEDDYEEDRYSSSPISKCACCKMSTHFIYKGEPGFFSEENYGNRSVPICSYNCLKEYKDKDSTLIGKISHHIQGF